MAEIPNLYLKWRVCRELIGIPQSDAQIGAHIFGEGKEGAPKFSKLLYGDYGCPPEIGTELVAILNRRLENYRKSRGLDPTIMDRFRPSDLAMPLHEFTRKFIAAAEQTDADALDRTQEALLKEMSPGFGSNGDARLVMERYERAGFRLEWNPPVARVQSPCRLANTRDGWQCLAWTESLQQPTRCSSATRARPGITAGILTGGKW